MNLYSHPIASFCWKVLIPLYENGTPFTPRMMEEEGVAQEWLALWPIGKFPLLRDSTRDMVVAEASIIIEYLATHEPGTFRPIPLNPDAALTVRMMDRLFDNYVMTPMQAIVADRIRPADVVKDPYGHSWSIAHHVRDVPPEEMQAAAEKGCG